jgi:acetylornithine deacetylase
MSPIPDTLIEAIRTTVESRRTDIVQLLLDLVAVPSVTGAEGAVQGVVERNYALRGLEIDRWEATREDIADYIVHVGEQAVYVNRPNLVGTRRGVGGERARSLMLQGHIDTVDNGDPGLWTRNPLGEATADRIYGRGAADMKGGIATYISVLDVLDALGLKLKGDLLLAASVGEEDGGLGALSTMLRGHRANAALISEPTNLEVVIAGGGSLVFRITVHGKSAHGAHRDQGVSAVEKFYPIFHDLLAWEAERNRELSHPLYDGYGNKFPISVGLVRAGTWASTVPEVLVAEGRLGFLPGETIEGMQAQAEARIMAVANDDPWMREHPPAIEWFGGQFASSEISPDEPIAQTIAAAHRTVTGNETRFVGVTAGLDKRLLVNIGGIPTAVYGAGDTNFVHCADEWIGIDDLLTAIEVSTVAVIEWCGLAAEDLDES